MSVPDREADENIVFTGENAMIGPLLQIGKPFYQKSRWIW